jgi:lipopolysaccharide transport system ATP-binding protein
MNDDVVIRVNSLGKSYIISHNSTIQNTSPRYHRFSEDLSALAMFPWRLLRKKIGYCSTATVERSEEFWAIKDISFEVQRCDVVGIIGRNGAGKSTLLKILSRITEPSRGRIELDGRVASLLEVGTGFHPELTGRENIYLNGAILGMSRTEVKRKFDEIVAFAELEKFLDTPVKRFSSGMYVRLAFAVAAHLESEIMLIDEILSVGDIDFQRKCMGKMNSVARSGRTILFVSHNMGAVRQLVNKCILIDRGAIKFMGNTDTCIDLYLKKNIRCSRSANKTFSHEPTDQCPAVIKRISLRTYNAIETNTFSLGSQWTMELTVEALRSGFRFQASTIISTESGLRVYHLVCRDSGLEYFTSTGTRFIISVTIPKLMLYPGRYSVEEVALLFPGTTSIMFHNLSYPISFSIDQSAGLEVSRQLGPSMAIVHEVAHWNIVASS